MSNTSTENKFFHDDNDSKPFEEFTGADGTHWNTSGFKQEAIIDTSSKDFVQKLHVTSTAYLGYTYPYFQNGHPINDWIWQTDKKDEAKKILIEMEGYTASQLNELI